MMLSRISNRAAFPVSRGIRSVRCFASADPTLNVSKCVDKAHEGKTFKQIVKLHPGALQGLKEGVADEMLATLGVKTIKDLAKWKHYRLAKAIAVLADTEVEGKRVEGSAANVNSGVDKAFEGASFTQLLAAPPSVLQGLAPWSIKDLSKWKFARWAEALVVAAEFENDEGGSR
ncbi:hypothetical protein Rsub_07789 [Raphidocelis subcapitata]|uniref:Uncharacterized protein n=1 Tax=Raphidocelis subcapitata TaxID=307507 RepID=A0A2V0P672_9CHLO|nr:hypothetical protein Rsub_07789 [Raphidocelis subcapitata]|eukprot:GBF95361.1 hypothetical protein Rsub_07789 [Raphidocelis subcapitata]